jgi:hypothetical protein
MRRWSARAVAVAGLVLLAGCGDPSVSAPSATRAIPLTGIPSTTGPATIAPATTGPAEPGAESLATGPTETVPPGPFPLRVWTHCGVRYLDPHVAGVRWITDEATTGAADWVPSEWVVPASGGELDVIVELIDASTLLVSTAGRGVRYRPVTPDEDEFRCE